MIVPLFLWRLFNRVPVVVVRRSTLRARERNGFELGRDFERYQRAEHGAA